MSSYHTGGVVSSQYIGVCSSHGYDTSKIKVGDRIEVGPQYYKKAVETIMEYGLKLTQVIWRKQHPDQIDECVNSLDEVAYRLITKKQYKMASSMLRFGLFDMKKHSPDSTKKRMIINLASAENLAGNKAEAARILRGEDWSASGDNYKICAAAVMGDVREVIRLMGPVVDGLLMKADNFRDWPVFSLIRSDSDFIREYERVFGEPLYFEQESIKLKEGARDVPLIEDNESDELEVNSDE